MVGRKEKSQSSDVRERRSRRVEISLAIVNSQFGHLCGRDFLQLVEKSDVVRRSFKELKSSAGGAKPSIFVADRPKPKRKQGQPAFPINAYK